MTQITVQPFQIASWPHAGASAELRIYFTTQFIDSEGNLILNGFYQSLICPVAGGTLTIPETILPSTTDGETNSSTVHAVFFDSIGRTLDVLTDAGTGRERFRIPPITPTTWAGIFLYNETEPADLPDTYYTAEQTDIWRADLLTQVVNIGDPAILALQETKYLNDYASLAAAIADIGATPTELRVSFDAAIAASGTIPDNVVVAFDGTGKLTVAAGQTVTISNMKDPGNRQVFAGAGAVRFARGAVQHMNVAWWVGPSDGVNVTAAINEMIANTILNNGGTMFFPDGVWLTDGNHNLPSGTNILGGGTYTVFPPGSLGGTCIKATTPGVPIFKIGENIRHVRLKDLTLDGDNLAGVDPLLCEGEYPNSSGYLWCENITFARGVHGLRINSLFNPTSVWQMFQVELHGCSFYFNSHSAIRCNTINTQIDVNSGTFGIQDNQWGFYLEACGALTVRNVEFAGLSGQAGDGGGGIPGDTMAEGCIYVGGEHGPLNFQGCQDEGFRYWLYVAVGSYEPITLWGCLIQSIVMLAETTTLNLFGCYALSKVVKDSGPASALVTAIGNFVDNRDVFNVPVNPPVLTDFSASSLCITEMNGVANRMFHRLPMRFLSPSQLNGDPTTPVVAIGNHTPTGESKKLLRIGRTTAPGVFDFYYDFTRVHDTGRLEIAGNQNYPNKGFDFNADIRATDFSMSSSIALGNAGAIDMDCMASNRFTITPTANVTITPINIIPGKKYYLTVLTAGAASFDIAFSAAFKGGGVLATGGVAGKYFVIEFYSPDAAVVLEISRTGAL